MRLSPMTRSSAKLPVKLLPLRWRVFRLGRLNRHGGMLPCKAWSLLYEADRCGKSMCRQLLADRRPSRVSVVSAVALHIAAVSCPSKQLLTALNVVKLGSRNKLSGSFPVS